MKTILWMLNKCKKLLYSFSKILPLLVGIAALFVAFQSMNNANRQFQINSVTSDSLFKVQLKNSKKLNDSLINQINILQEITNMQLQITEKQLKISTELLQDQIYSGRPKIVILSNKIIDTLNLSEEYFTPIVQTVYENIGDRFAINLSIRNFYISNNFTKLESNLDNKSSFLVETNATRRNKTMPQIKNESKDDFYYCFEYIYFDNTLNQEFTQSYYFRYHKIMGIYNFYNCKNEDEIKLKEIINKWLKKKNERLFDQ